MEAVVRSERLQLANSSRLAAALPEPLEVRRRRLISENPVVIFSRPSCSMCQVMRNLLNRLGVNPTIIESANDSTSVDPILFINGERVGSLESMVALHLSGNLFPKLVDAGAFSRRPSSLPKFRLRELDSSTPLNSVDVGDSLDRFQTATNNYKTCDEIKQSPKLHEISGHKSGTKSLDHKLQEPFYHPSFEEGRATAEKFIGERLLRRFRMLKIPELTEDVLSHRETLLLLDEPEPLSHLSMLNTYGGPTLANRMGTPLCHHLLVLYLDRCIHSTSLPPLGHLPFLGCLIIKNFWRLENVGPEFYGEISSQFTPFRALSVLWFENLPRWTKWVVGQRIRGAFPVLQDLYLIDCPWLATDLPVELPSLKRLEIMECEELNVGLPRMPQISKLDLQNNEQMDLTGLGDLSSLTTLVLSFHKENKTFAPDLQRLTSLRALTIDGYHSHCDVAELRLPHTLQTLVISQSLDECQPSVPLFRCIPSEITSLSIGCFKGLDLPKHTYMFLRHLYIYDCCFLHPSYFPLGHFPVLKCLEVNKCSHMESFDISPEAGDMICLPSLTNLLIDNCPDFLRFPKEGFSAPKVTTLSITSCKNLLALPEGMHTGLSSLRRLTIKDCSELNSFPKGGLPRSLHTLTVAYCKRLASRWKQWKLHELVSLRQLEIQGFEDMECFPPEGWLPASLNSLFIIHFPDLTYLMGQELQRLTSLQELKLMNCPNLESLPEEGLPSSLVSLGIYFCPLLRKQCQRGTGEDWPKVAHLSDINIL